MHEHDDQPTAARAPRRRRAAVAVAALLVAVLAAALGPRAYDVGATTPHSPLLEKTLRYAMEQSVRGQAADVQIPPDVDLLDAALAERAVGHYSVVCAPCHAAPGALRAPWMVLYPPPPALTEPEVVEAWSDEELFWVIKHGIKDTGMVALPPGHSDEDVWAVAAFVRQLPGMSPARYEALVEAYRAKSHGSGHGSHDH